eukprot:2046879-Rhodomonas_salina.2
MLPAPPVPLRAGSSPQGSSKRTSSCEPPPEKVPLLWLTGHVPRSSKTKRDRYHTCYATCGTLKGYALRRAVLRYSLLCDVRRQGLVSSLCEAQPGTTPLSSYAVATRCPVLCYELSGTELRAVRS